MLGAVVGMGLEALHGVIAQARPQAFAQGFPGQVLLRSRVEQFAVLGHEARQVAGQQAQGAHRRHHLQLFQAPTGQLEEHRRVAFGTQQAHRHLAVRLAGVLQVQDEALHTAVAPGEEGGEVRGEAAQGEQQRLVRFHLEVELDARIELIRRQVAVQGHGAAPLQFVQVLQHPCGEALGQGLAGQRQDLLHAPQPHAPQGRGHLRLEAGTLHRHALQRILQRRALFHRQAIVDVGQHAGRHRIGRHHDAMTEAERRQLLAQARLEARPGPEQRQAGGDLQQQHAGVAQADMGAEAVAPGGEKALPVLDLPGVVFSLGEITGQRVGGGQAHARAQPQGPGGRVDRLQHAALGRAGDQGQGRFGVVAAAQHGVQRQLRQQDAGPAHQCPARARVPVGARPPRHLSTRTRPGPSSARRRAAGDGLRASCRGR